MGRERCLRGRTASFQCCTGVKCTDSSQVAQVRILGLPLAGFVTCANYFTSLGLAFSKCYSVSPCLSPFSMSASGHPLSLPVILRTLGGLPATCPPTSQLGIPHTLPACHLLLLLFNQSLLLWPVSISLEFCLSTTDHFSCCPFFSPQTLATGGNGYINDFPMGRFLRDAKLYEIGGGTSEIRRLIIGRAFNKDFH